MKLSPVRLASSPNLFATVGLALALAVPAAPLFAQDKSDKAAQAAKEKREKDLAKAKEDLQKKLNLKKIDPAPAISFLATLVESAEVDVPTAKGLVEQVISKKIPFEDASHAIDKCLADNPKDPKKVLKDFQEWMKKWKPKEAPKPDPKAGDKPADPKKP